MAAVCTHLWSLRWQWHLALTPGACVGSALLPESAHTHRERNSYMVVPPLSLHTLLSLLLWRAQASSCTPLVGAPHTPGPSGCLYTANPSPLPRSDLHSPSFNTQPPPTPVDEQASQAGGGARRWHRPSLQVSLPFAFCKLVAAPSSEAPKLPLCPG